MLNLSILIPSIPSRIDKLKRLYGKLEQQIINKDVEVLSLCDNKTMSIGVKRDKLLQLARGRYITFIDDDDDIEMDYILEVLRGIEKKPDVICYKESCCINGGNRFIVDYGLNYENEEAKQIDEIWIDIKRKPFHKCIWKSEIAKSEHFADSSYGEDWDWAKRLCNKANIEYKINKIIYSYDYNEKTTEAPELKPRE